MAKWVAHLLMLASLLMPALTLVSQQHSEAHIHNSDVATPPRFVHTHHDLCGLEDLTDCKHLAHYRFITEIQTVEVFTTDGEAFGGNLVSFARLLRQGKEYVEGQKVYAQIQPLSDSLAHHIFHAFDTLGIPGLPSADSLPCWKLYVCGTAWATQFKDAAGVRWSTYGNVDSQDTLCKAAMALLALEHQLSTELGMAKHFFQLIDRLPPGVYRAPGPAVVINSAKHKRPTRR